MKADSIHSTTISHYVVCPAYPPILTTFNRRTTYTAEQDVRIPDCDQLYSGIDKLCLYLLHGTKNINRCVVHMPTHPLLYS